MKPILGTILTVFAVFSTPSHAQLMENLGAWAQIGVGVLNGDGVPDINALQYGAGVRVERSASQKQIDALFEASGTTAKHLISFIREAGLEQPFNDDGIGSLQQAQHSKNIYFENLNRDLGAPGWDHVAHDPNPASPWTMADVPFTADLKIMKFLAATYRGRTSNLVKVLLDQFSRLGLPESNDVKDRLTLLRFMRINVKLQAGGNRLGYGDSPVVADFLALHGGDFSAKERLAVNDQLFDVQTNDAVVTILNSNDQDIADRLEREAKFTQIQDAYWSGSQYISPDRLTDARKDRARLVLEMNQRFNWVTENEAKLNEMFPSPLSAADKKFILRKLFLNETSTEQRASALTWQQQRLLDYVSLSLVRREPEFVLSLMERGLKSGALAPESWRNVAGEIYAKMMMNLTASGVNAVTYARFYNQFQNSLRVAHDRLTLNMIETRGDEKTWIYDTIAGKMAQLLRRSSPATVDQVRAILGVNMPSDIDINGSAFHGMAPKQVPADLPVFAQLDCVARLLPRVEARTHRAILLDK